MPFAATSGWVRCGIASLTILMLVLRLAGAFEFGSVALRGTNILKFAVYYALFFLLTGFFEEFLVRGYCKGYFARNVLLAAAALLSAGFGALHSANPGESKAGLIAAALIGFFFCLYPRRTETCGGSRFHMSWIGRRATSISVPDSGGMMTGHLLNSSFHVPDWLTGGQSAQKA